MIAKFVFNLPFLLVLLTIYEFFICVNIFFYTNTKILFGTVNGFSLLFAAELSFFQGRRVGFGAAQSGKNGRENGCRRIWETYLRGLSPQARGDMKALKCCLPGSTRCWTGDEKGAARPNGLAAPSGSGSAGKGGGSVFLHCDGAARWVRRIADKRQSYIICWTLRIRLMESLAFPMWTRRAFSKAASSRSRMALKIILCSSTPAISFCLLCRWKI